MGISASIVPNYPPRKLECKHFVGTCRHSWKSALKSLIFFPKISLQVTHLRTAAPCIQYCSHEHLVTYVFFVVNVIIYMRVVLNSFIWKTSSSPKKKFFRRTFANSMFFLSRYMLAKIFKKNVDVWYPQIVPGVWSLVTLHSAAAALKHLRSALRCWSLLTSSVSLTQQVHSLGHLAFKWRSSFAKALAILSPNFREKPPIVLQNETYIHNKH